ncbi:hypothetical protein HPB47_026933 [Ixodes persulcatus]|uniref:Uncharacterized protein n=1 Tax=Ixodes persulcatus TaxID=34615 RepID=A0AC60PYS9_IXOPE|nr:hypothetical protein HPB47_026933 [Ixodes persulcatus]
MRVLLAIVLAGCLLELGSCLMSPSYFASQHKSRCFVPYRDNRHVKMGQQVPAGFTMSSFLDRLELLEEKLATTPGIRPFTPIDMAAFLLRKFSYYDYTWTRLGIADMRDTNHAKELINIIMANLRDDTINPDTLLDQDDICFFVFSLAHNVNSTLTYQKFDTYSANPEVQVQETPREEGVVSVTGSADTTVAIGRTLFGIAAAHDAIQDKSIKDAIGSTTESTAGNPQTEKEALLKPIPAVTVGDVLGSSAVLHSRVQLQKNFGLTGEWFESGCMLEFKLSRATNTSATLAHIAGAIDGLILGTELKLPNSQLRNWNLSTILRTYYGPQAPCETPTDLYLVLDTSQDVATNEIYRKLQSEILGVITRQLKFENGVSTLRVYGSKRDGTLLQELARPSAAGGCPACAALFLTDMERNVPIFAVGLKETLDALNAGSAALTVVDISQLTQLVQQEPLDLKPVKENNELKSLVKKICQVPAALQYKNSMSRDSRLRSEPQATFEGFVTPRTVQYWSYDTEFYSASNYLQIKFTAGNGSPVRVCDLTGRVIDGTLAGRMCYETSNQMKAVSFNYTKPCKRGPNSCSPLTFAVVGKDDAPGQQQSLTDVESCTGMYGAGVLSAVFSPLMLLLTALALSRNALHS